MKTTGREAHSIESEQTTHMVLDVGGDLQTLRGHNREAVLRVARRYPGGASLTEIHTHTSLSRPTVKLALDELRERGLVTEAEIGASGKRGGRPARRYRPDPSAGLVVGAVIGLEHIDVMVSDINGDHVIRSTQPRDSQLLYREQLAQEIRTALEQSTLPDVKPSVITIGVLGIVAPNGVVLRSDGMTEIVDDDYFSPIEHEFECMVLVENDANLAATAEFASLNRPDIRDMVGLHADVAIGCGLILNSTLHRGHAGAAGEMGFYPLLGWRDSQEALKETAEAHGMSVAGLFGVAGKKTPWAAEAVRQFAREIAPGVLSIVLTLNPQLIVVGGAICAANDIFREPLQEFIATHAPSVPEITFSELGKDCIVLGALSRSTEVAWNDMYARAHTADNGSE